MAEYDFDTEGVKKTFTFMNRKAPYGTIYALEVLETVPDGSGGWVNRPRTLAMDKSDQLTR